MAAIACAALSGCGRTAGVLLQPDPGAPVWPPPPDVPRIRYLGEFKTDRDLKPGRRRGGLGELIFGEEPPQSMLSPLGLAFAGSRLFVADSNGQVLHVFDLESRKYMRWQPGKGQAPFSMPVAVAAEPSGGALVSDSVAGVVLRFDAAGACTGVLGKGLLKRPCGVAVDPAGERIFIVDSAAHQVVVLSMTGQELLRLGVRGSAPGEFNFPTNLAFDPTGHLYVSDTLNFRIQVFSRELRPVRQMGRKGDGPGFFAQPKGLAVDPAGRLYIVDANFEAVQVFDAEGNLLMAFGREGHNAGEFWLPSGITIDASGRIWIADTYNRRVQVFEALMEGTSP
jgi:DNA-binding beta-propeller fold protein YncE